MLPGKLAGVFDIRKQQWVTLQHVASPHQNEKVAAPALLQTVPRGSLLLQDLGYFSFQWFDDLTDGGYYWISRLRRKTSYKPVHTYYEAGDTFDGLVWLGAHRADRAAHAVRLVRFKVGTQLKEYITNVTDPQQLSLKEIATLYARRWDIEMAVKAVKRYLDLHLLWSSKTDVILQQVWAVFIIAQIFHALQLEVAGKAGVDPFDVSLPLLIEYYPFFAADGSDPVAIFVQHGREGRFIRPSRRIRIRLPSSPLRT